MGRKVRGTRRHRAPHKEQGLGWGWMRSPCWGGLVALCTSNEVQQAHPGGCSLSLSDFIPAFIPTAPLLYPINLPSPPVKAEAQRIHHEKWHNNAEMGYQHTPAENESVKQQGKQQLFKRSKDLTPTKRK